ncbi:MAG: MATE family efflux transporter, partial [Treponema sp.]|nr:MATE family efflux transporter [Treponema sp.]
MKNQLDMTKGPIFKELIIFSVPLILSGVLQLLFNAADVIVVGRFAGDNSLAAVGSTSSFINLMLNLFIGLSIGSSVVSANYFGAGKIRELRNTVHTSMLLSIYSGIGLTILGVIFARPILHLMQAPEEVLVLAVLYLRIYFAGISATVIFNFGSALLRAKGDTKRPLYILLVAGLINVILNLIFVICFRMD